MITVVVIEPYTMLRSGILEHLAKAMPASKLIGADYSALSEDAPPTQNSDLVLLSVLLNENVHSLLSAAQRVYTPKSILLLTDPVALSDTWHSLPRDIAGYVPRDASPDMLAAAIHLVLAGGSCFQKSPRTTEPTRANSPAHLVHDQATTPIRAGTNHLLRRATDRVGSACAEATDLSPPINSNINEAHMLSLTPRQYDVLLLLARGYSAKVISRKLNISTATVKVHTEALYQRLHAHNRNQAVYAAISLGATLGWDQLYRNRKLPNAPHPLYEHP